ncbi:MAG: MBL fold metallo-hydrolase [Clostridiales bacterium]|nr:MBL fold metallo-hydrolase [Clostridiales bacterium]
MSPGWQSVPPDLCAGVLRIPTTSLRTGLGMTRKFFRLLSLRCRFTNRLQQSAPPKGRKHGFLRSLRSPGMTKTMFSKKEKNIMELRPVLGSTYVADGATALLPIYKLNSTDIVLLDTGYAKLDRSALTHLLDDNGFHLKGILCSHAHFDHTGNVRYLQQRYGALAAAQLIEAGISVNPDAYRANYVALTYGRSRAYFLEECFTADVIIPADATELNFCGAKFGILQLPGHSAGHIGIVTPDGVAYLGDCLISRSEIEGAKLPTSMFIARDLESKQSLYSLRCPAYIVAHKEVLTDITELIGENIRFIRDKAREMLSCLQDGMTFDQWIYEFCKKENVRTHNQLKFSIVERNFSNFVAWMEDEGLVEIRREFCAKKYYRT